VAPSGEEPGVTHITAMVDLDDPDAVIVGLLTTVAAGVVYAHSDRRELWHSPLSPGFVARLFPVCSGEPAHDRNEAISVCQQVIHRGRRETTVPVRNAAEYLLV